MQSRTNFFLAAAAMLLVFALGLVSHEHPQGVKRMAAPKFAVEMLSTDGPSYLTLEANQSAWSLLTGEPWLVRVAGGDTDGRATQSLSYNLL